jgi:hypothetical protein
MVIKFGAAIPRRCFVSGEETTLSIEVVQRIRPAWVYLLLLLGVLPYFLVAPWVSRTVRLRVPVSHGIYQQHLNGINRGFALILIGVLMTIAGAVGGPVFSASSLLLPLGIAVCLVGLFLSSNQPIMLHIASLEGDELVLGNLHPRCLADLPQELAPHGNPGQRA